MRTSRSGSPRPAWPRARPSSSARVPQDSARAVDLVGTGLLTTSLLCALVPLVEGRQQGRPAGSWLSLGAGPIFLRAFVMVTPIVLGGGTPLFQGGYDRFELELLEARPLDTGAVILHYRAKR